MTSGIRSRITIKLSRLVINQFRNPEGQTGLGEKEVSDLGAKGLNGSANPSMGLGFIIICAIYRTGLEQLGDSGGVIRSADVVASDP